MRNEHFGECRFLMDHLDNSRLFQSRDDGVRHGRDGSAALCLPGQTSLAEELAHAENCDDGFLALLGDDGELRLAFLDVEDRIGSVPLRKDNLTFPVLANAAAFPDTGEEVLRIE